MRKIGRGIYHIQENVRKAYYRVFKEPFIKMAFSECGKNVHIAEKCDFKGIENIKVGEGTTIGPHALIWTTKAKVHIAEKVIIGPYLTVITGNHRTNIVGKYLADVKDNEKQVQDDEDVIIERDVWIGANVTILKGVNIAEGCIIAAGAVLPKSTEPYGVYAGVPAKKISTRFSEEEIEIHRMRINQNY